MSDEELTGLLGRVRSTYHVPPETPRDEMWRVISVRLEEDRSSAGPDPAADAEVLDLGAARRRRGLASRPLAWAAAAAAVLALGIGIGRTTAPTGSAAPLASAGASTRGALELAAQEHLGRTESLLTMVRADARNGALDPATGVWARTLLSETRMLMDSRRAGDPAVDRLLEDLELVLVQIVGAAEMGPADGARARTEVDLALRGLEQGEVLTRIQAALPEGMVGA